MKSTPSTHIRYRCAGRNQTVIVDDINIARIMRRCDIWQTRRKYTDFEVARAFDFNGATIFKIMCEKVENRWRVHRRVV